MLLILLFVGLTAAAGIYEGESCVHDGREGACRQLALCESAKAGIRVNRTRPQTCSFYGSFPIVCCFDTVVTSRLPEPVATTARPAPSTTEYVPPSYDYVSVNEGSGGCDALPPSLTAPKTGRIAWDKCVDYQQQLVYPCAPSVALAGGETRQSLCGHSTDQLIVGGTDAERGEFPHMALLGYGDTPGNFICAGSLISERFILTAGHCTYSREFGAVTFALLAAVKRSDPLDRSRVHAIGRVVKHPDYKPPTKYNDIALLETKDPIKLDRWTVPACLDVALGVQADQAVATGWGLTQHRGKVADKLQKVTLKRFPSAKCSSSFKPERNMKRGYHEPSQTCYGDTEESKDTCQGDSGGPLQVKNRRLSCMYTIVGVTSFGKACGFVGEPAIYTRVSAFVPWIESVVWK